MFSYSRRYAHLLRNPRDIDALKPSIRTNTIKSLRILAKYLGIYREFRERCEDYGIKTKKANVFASFIRIFNNSNNDVLEWYKKASKCLDPNQKLYLRFVALTGLRKQEAIDSFNLTIRLSKEEDLHKYFDRNLDLLRHFNFKGLFLRRTKNTYISFVHKRLISKIEHSQPIKYKVLTRQLKHNGLNTRINELRDFFATFMVRHGLIREEVDLLQGRIPPNIFTRHYWSPSLKELRNRVFESLKQLEQKL